MTFKKTMTMTTLTPLPAQAPRAPAGGERSLQARAAIALCLSLLAGLGGCAMSPPAAWEKGQLAKPAMRMDGDGLEQRFTQHIYASKENASGGQSVGGGGCGCN